MSQVTSVRILSVIATSVLASSRTLSQTESIVSSADDLVEALEDPPEDGRLIIDARRLSLEDFLIIRQDNLIIEGVSPRPIITCPPNQPAFIIEASGIRLESLEFSNCLGNSSILIQGVDRRVTATDVVIQDVIFRGNEAVFGAGIAVVPCMTQSCNRSVVTISSCQFEDNEAVIGGSIHAQNTALFIRDSTFLRNIARGTAGSIYIDNGLHGLHRLHRSILNISESNFTENIARGVLEEGENMETVTPGRAGAIYASSTANCSISTSRFTSNRGCLGSGAIEVINLSPDSEESVSYMMNIDNCTFTSNYAYCQLAPDDILVEDFSSPNYVGGAMSYGARGIMDLTWTVRNCYFVDNKAHHGGALTIVGTSETDHHVLDSVFDYNQVLGGGGCVLIVNTNFILSRSTLSNSQGVFGGGLVVIDQGTLTTDPDLDEGLGSVFYNNTAVYGGALFLVYTGLVNLTGLVVRNNTAFRYGGGLRYYDSPSSIEMNGVYFEGNAARVGGAAAMLGFGNLSISEHKNRRSVFQDNKSVVGGALFLEIGHFIAFFVNITHADFNRNEAMERENPFIQSLVDQDSNYSPIDGLTVEILSIIMSRSEEEDILGRMTDIDDGRGGGVCLALEPMRVYTNAEILFSSVTMTGNRGIVGAGLAAFVGNLEWNNGSISTCFPTSFGLQACRLLQFQDVNMTQNEAQFAGGLFLTNPLAISNACDRFNPGLNRSLPEIMQIQTQMERNERPFSQSDLHCTYLHDNIILSNTNSTSGADVGTTVQSLELRNVRGRHLAETASRERLSVSCPLNYNDAMEDCEPLEIAVKDAFGQTIERAIPDSKLEVTLQSENITGDQRYQASEGIINITGTLAWGINMTSQLTIFSDRQNDLKVSTSFSTRSCYPGEVPQQEDPECRPCAPDEYSFDPDESEECKECEEHAICRGKAALVPQDTYWHSTPFSPAFSECIIEEACVFDGRVDILTDYYSNNLRLIEELRLLDEYVEGTGDLPPFLEYKQCNDGYDGIRCGSCVEGYGHSYNGKCEECPNERSIAETVATFAIFWVFIFLTANCLITLSSTKARIRLALEQSRASVAHPNRSLKKAPGFKKPEVRPTLVRSLTIHERNAEQDAMAIESLTQQLTSTVQLIEMIKILINYFQITSIALHLHIEWIASIKWVLSIEGVIAGVLGESLIIPFECSFDQDSRVAPAIAALWVRAAVPFMVLATLILLFLISWYFSRKRHHHQQRTPAANRLSLTTCLIILTIVALYFSYLSIIRELLRTINCVRGEHIQHVNATNYLSYAVHRNKVVWAEDTDLTCFEGEHLATGIAGTIGVGLCLSLMLFIVWIALQRKRFSDPEFIGRYWFLYQAYRREWHTSAWEAVILLRKALIAAVVVFSVHLGPNLQASICVGILFIAQMLHTIARPYEEYPDQVKVPEYTGTVLKYLFPNWAEDWTVLNNGIGLNSLESMSLMSSVVVFFTGIILHDSYSSDKGKIIMTVFGIGINLSFVVFMLYRMYLSVHLILDHKLETCSPSFVVNYQENGSFMSLFVKFKEVLRQRLESGTSFVEIAYLNSRNVLPVVSESHDSPPGASRSN